MDTENPLYTTRYSMVHQHHQISLPTESRNLITSIQYFRRRANEWRSFQTPLQGRGWTRALHISMKKQRLRPNHFPLLASYIRIWNPISEYSTFLDHRHIWTTCALRNKWRPVQCRVRQGLAKLTAHLGWSWAGGCALVRMMAAKVGEQNLLHWSSLCRSIHDTFPIQLHNVLMMQYTRANATAGHRFPRSCELQATFRLTDTVTVAGGALHLFSRWYRLLKTTYQLNWY